MSHAEWPEGTATLSWNRTFDHHFTKKEAQSVCDRLNDEGFGGDGLIFPIKTWVTELDK